MNQTTPSPVNDDTITEAAAQWFMRLQEDDCTDAERRAFSHWLAASPRHACEYEAIQGTWHACEGLPPARDASGSAVSHQDTLKRPVYKRTFSFAAAAVIFLLGLLAGWSQGWVPSDYESYEALNTSKLVTLPDGSRVELNLGTRLTYTRYKNRRIVGLDKGEAFFEVARDTLRPFIVHAAQGSIRATGTRFNVWLYDDQVNVMLVEGSVMVAGDRAYPDRSVHLTPGMQAHYSGSDRQAETRMTQNGDTSLAWRYGKLVFNDLPLRQALPLINRYLPTPIMLADNATAELRLGLSYNIREMSRLLTSLPQVLPVRISQNEQGHPVLHKQLPSPPRS